MVPYLQPSGQALQVGMKLWFQSDLLKVTKVGMQLLTVAFFVFDFLRQMRYFFVTGHTTNVNKTNF